MPARLLSLTFDAADPARLGRFWGELLDREPVPDGDAILLPGSDTQVGLGFSPATGVDERTEAAYVHLHLTSAGEDDQQRTVERALASGARHLDVGQLPDEDHIVLADPEGNAFCVIEAGNAYLAGCGFLGELACDGTREVGSFWRDALGWPLAWDRDSETAIQSPDGGTKIAWGGPPLDVRTVNRQRFRLVVPAADRDAEIDRLLYLGATLRSLAAESVLTDPDGNAFTLVAVATD